MKKINRDFSAAHQAGGAFGLHAEAVIEKAQKSQLVSSADPAGDEAYALFSEAAKTTPYHAAAPHFSQLLKALDDTSIEHEVFADRVATLAVARAQTYETAAEQIVNQLYLADISEANPAYEQILPHVEAIRYDVASTLGLLQDRQRIGMRSEITSLSEDLSARSRNLLGIYIPGFGTTVAAAPATENVPVPK